MTLPLFVSFKASSNEDQAYANSFVAIFNGSVSPFNSTITGAFILNREDESNGILSYESQGLS